jgi:hypothetical protein
LDYDSFLLKPDQDHVDLVDLSTSIYSAYYSGKDEEANNFYYGLQLDWSARALPAEKNPCYNAG